jgi:hypothetical protein
VVRPNHRVNHSKSVLVTHEHSKFTTRCDSSLGETNYPCSNKRILNCRSLRVGGGGGGGLDAKGDRM